MLEKCGHLDLVPGSYLIKLEQLEFKLEKIIEIAGKFRKFYFKGIASKRCLTYFSS